MRSDAGNVDGYLSEPPDDRRKCLQTIRVACTELLTGFEESMAYGMLSYSRKW